MRKKFGQEKGNNRPLIFYSYKKMASLRPDPNPPAACKKQKKVVTVLRGNASPEIPIIPEIIEFSTPSADIHKIEYHLGELIITDEKLHPERPGQKPPKSRLAIRIFNYLNISEIDFNLEQSFEKCRDIYALPFDFILFINDGKVNKTAIIEADGQQHFVHTPFFQKTLEDFEKQKRHDVVKNRFTRERNISLLRISDRDIEHTEFLLGKFISLVKESKTRIDMFSNEEQYKKPYGSRDEDHDSGCIIS